MTRFNHRFRRVACLLLGALALAGCRDGNDWDVDKSYDRLFGINAGSISIEPEDISATVAFTGVPNAQYYIVEISTDSLYDDIPLGGTAHSVIFGQDQTIKKSPAVLTDLAGDTRYFLRIKAQNSEKGDPHWAYYTKSDVVSTFKTKAEQIFNAVESGDRDEDKIRVTWDATKEVTAIQVAQGGDVVQTITLSDADKAAGEYTITGLIPSTTYTITILNGEAVRGTLAVSTTAAMPAADFKYYLPADVTLISADLLNTIAEEAKAAAESTTNYSVTIGIPAGIEIDLHGVSSTDGSATNVTLPDGMAVTFFGLAGGEAPTIKFQKNLNVAGTHAYVAFENVNIVDDGAGYFLNQGDACTIGEFSVKDAEVSKFKTSFFRMQNSNEKVIEKLTLSNSIFHDMCSGYSFIHVDAGAGKGVVKNIAIDGCTLYNIATGGKMFIYSNKTEMESISVRNTTFYNCIGNNNYWVDFNNTGTTGKFEFYRCLFTKTPDESTKNIRSTTAYTMEESYKTTDFFKNLAGLNELGVSADDLFVDPAGGNFHFKGGRILYAGDPRWYTEE